MKAKYLFLAATLLAGMSAGCNSGNSNKATVSNATDSVATDTVETIAPEPVKVDTAAVEAEVDSTLTAILKKARAQINKADTKEYELVTNERFSADLVEQFSALLRKVKAECKKHGEQSPGVPSYVPQTEQYSMFFCCKEPDGSDCGVTVDKFKITSIELSDNLEKAEVKVKVNSSQECAGDEAPSYFNNTITYALVKTDGKWLIDDILHKEYTGGSLRRSVKAGKALVPEFFL